MSEATIKFSCECGKAYKVPDKFAGKRVRCKQCGETVAVPSSSEPVSSSRAAAVSQRSVVSSRKLAVPDDEDDEDSAPKKKSQKVKAPSQRLKAAAPPPKKGGDTQVIELVDLTPELKRYSRKREEEIPKGTGKLVQFDQGKAIKSHRLDKEKKVLGRSSSCQIVVEDKSVSKEHVRFEYMMGMFIATDLGSQNGLVVNGKKIRRAQLKDGDVLQLGAIVFRVDCGK